MRSINLNNNYGIKEITMTSHKEMKTYRTTAKIVGVLYILGFVVGIAGSVLSEPGQIDAVSARSIIVAIGALLWVLAAVGDAAHGVLMFPILKQYSERIALGYFGARIVEASIIAISALFILLQIPLSDEYLKAGPSNIFYLQSLSALFTQSQQYAYQIGMMALGIAGLILCNGFIHAKLVPRYMVIWGLVGYMSFLGGSMLEVIGFNLKLIHTIPGGLWEISIGVWLFANGFTSPKFVSQAEKQNVK
jgi:hypothetical protein